MQTDYLWADVISPAVGEGLIARARGLKRCRKDGSAERGRGVRGGMESEEADVTWMGRERTPGVEGVSHAAVWSGGP
jgi:hypothetical protein